MINKIKLNGNRLFAILDSNNYVIDCWVAKTLEEAQQDNLGKIVIEVALENSPFTLGQKITPK
jgi:phage antirepressor YoqD-like protein